MSLPEKISPYWRSILQGLKGDSYREDSLLADAALKALERQVCFSSKENIVLSYETPDPLGATYHQPILEDEVLLASENFSTRLVRQYKNRCLFIVTGRCFAHCRYCFRRESSVLRLAFVSDTGIQKLCDYLSTHAEIQEVLLSGGDPLTATDAQLKKLLHKLRSVRPDLLIRIGSRAPIFAPERLTLKLIRLLQSFKPLWLIPHINHPVEISPEFAPKSRSVLQTLQEAGIPMQSQTVLLRGVNDSIEILHKLFSDITLLGIRPGYLFQGDLAPGTSHLRLPLDKGIELYENLRKELSGLSTPVYALDLPRGGGKINLLQAGNDLLTIQTERKKNAYCFRDNYGNRWEYPLEKH